MPTCASRSTAPTVRPASWLRASWRPPVPAYRSTSTQPDGVNINLGCGATAPAALAGQVAASGSDVGFALDGDADRCVTVDESGEIVDGDQLLGIIALDRLERGALDEATLVVSVLSNGGLADAVEHAGGRVVRTPVGDKYILEAMLVSGAGVGGEKSGHVIIRQHTTSGDGIVTALEVLDIMTRTGRGSRSWRPASRCTRSNSAPSRCVTRISGRPTASSWTPSTPPRRSWPDGVASWCGRRAPSRRCASWSRARTRPASRSWPTSCPPLPSCD